MHWKAGTAVLGLVLLTTACPEQKKPDRGLELQYRKARKGDVRAVVERRLAALQVKARIDEEPETLRLRLPEGSDPTLVKRLMAMGGTFELCEELPADALHWCETQLPEGVIRTTEDPPAGGCFLTGTDAALVRKTAELGISGRVVLQKSGGEVRSYAVPQECLKPGVAEATVREVQGFAFPAVQLRFDRAGGQMFEAITTRSVNKRILLVLDDEVQIAPIVREPIRGGAAQLTTTTTEAEARVLAAALQGGALPAMTLEVERTYGPPSLTR